MELELSSFPIIASIVKDGTRLTQVFELLRNKDGKFNKARFSELKSLANRAFEGIWEIAINKVYAFNASYAKTREEEEFLWTIGTPECHTVAARQKKLAASKVDTPYANAMRDLLKEFAVIADAVNASKDDIVAKVVKTEEEKRPVYVPPHASRKAARAVSDILVKMTEAKFEHLKSFIRGEYMTVIESYETEAKSAFQATGKKYTMADFCTYETKGRYGGKVRMIDSEKYAILRGVFDPKSDLPIRLDSAEAYLDQRVTREAEDTRAQFLHKNMQKLTPILEAKGDFDRAEILPSGLKMNFLEGGFNVYFEDGAQFTVINSIVWAPSSKGKLYTRFPTTFHDVYMAGKVKVSNPSEQRMNEVFVKGGANA